MERIVVCDPHPGVRALLAEVAASLGHLVVDCQTVEPVDALVLEPAAPEALERARELRGAWPDLPIIFVSERTAHPAAAEFSPTAYLVKPFTLAEIEAALLLV